MRNSIRDHRLFSIHTRLEQYFQEALALQGIIPVVVIVHHFHVLMVLLSVQQDQVNFSDQGNRVDLVSQQRMEGISVNQMLQKRISKQQNEEQNISSHFSPLKKRISIHFDVKKVLLVKNKKKISMTSNKHLLIVLVRKWRLGISSRSKNFLTKSVFLSHVSSES